MKKQLLKIGIVLILVSLFNCASTAQTINNTSVRDTSYVSNIITELNKQWPANRTINLVFHGHSVPSGYFKTPIVNTLGSYPYLLWSKLNAKYPYAVINIIKTSIGGENSEQGEKRFKKDVLTHKPDVVFIDYALNDRNLGLERARTAWEKMIKAALKQNIKVVLLTPTPDVTENILDAKALLAQHTAQIIALGAKYRIPVVDNYQQFKNIKAGGQSLEPYMAQFNHINEKGHEIVAREIAVLFDVER
jgi:acyl-CoA thioesterase-1